MATATPIQGVTTQPMPPMVSGERPVLGHMVEYMRDPIGFLERGYREHGSIYTMKMATQPHVVILGPDNNKFFFTETDKRLSIREGYPFFLKMFSKDFYFFAEHDDYMKQREIVMPKFKGDQMRSYVGLMAEETNELIAKLGDEGEFDLIPTLGPLVMNIAAHAFLGRDFRGKLDDGFFDDFRDFSGGMEVVWPLWMPLKHLRKSKKARKKLDRILTQWIQYRRENPMDPPDFFQNLIDAKFSTGEPVSEDIMVNIILLLVWAGHETTAGQISWSLIDMLQHPEYLDAVRAETRAVLGDRSVSEMTWQDARDLVSVELAVKESERMHPVAYVLMRMAKEDIELEGYRIPKGTPVLAAPAITHRMPEVFANPQAYNPRRFTPGTGEAGPETNRLIGFGGGLHRCAGVNFARLEMKIILTALAQQYDMELIDSPRPISGTMTHWPAQPTRVRYTRRTQEAMSEEELANAAAAREAVSATAADSPFDDDSEPGGAFARAEKEGAEASGCPFHADAEAKVETDAKETSESGGCPFH